MKFFKLHNSEFNLDFNKVLGFFKKIFSGIFKLIKKPIVTMIIISLISGFVGGFIGRTYINPGNKSGTFLGIKLASNNVEQENSVKTLKTIPEVVKEVSPAVVSVIVSQYVPIFEQEYYNPFGENSPFQIQIPRMVEKGKELKEIGGGSGFIVSADGLIVTNKHVVLEEKAEYTVLTNDGQKYPATVLSRDPIQDVAVLKINATNLPTVILGDSDNLEIGQTVIAIGNALGEFRNTVSAGIISGLMRSVTAGGGGFSEQLEEVIQTDAAINPGNSGGPLLNLYGEVIGINTAVAQYAENIGFAIPVNKIKKDVQDVKTKGKIVYPFLGVRYVLINQTIKEKNNLSVDYGALIQKGSGSGEPAIMPGSPAEKAGLQVNDIILEVNNERIDEQNTLSKLLIQYSPNQEITLKILRKDEEKIIKVTLDEWK